MSLGTIVWHTRFVPSPPSLGYGMDVASWLCAGVVGQPRRDPVSGQILGSNRTSSDITTNVHYVTLNYRVVAQSSL